MMFEKFPIFCDHYFEHNLYNVVRTMFRFFSKELNSHKSIYKKKVICLYGNFSEFSFLIDPRSTQKYLKSLTIASGFLLAYLSRRIVDFGKNITLYEYLPEVVGVIFASPVRLASDINGIGRGRKGSASPKLFAREDLI